MIKKEPELLIFSSAYLLKMIFSDHYNLIETDIVNAIKDIIKRQNKSVLPDFRSIILSSMPNLSLDISDSEYSIIKGANNVEITFLLLQKNINFLFGDLEDLECLSKHRY